MVNQNFDPRKKAENSLASNSSCSLEGFLPFSKDARPKSAARAPACAFRVLNFKNVLKKFGRARSTNFLNPDFSNSNFTLVFYLCMRITFMIYLTRGRKPQNRVFVLRGPFCSILRFFIKPSGTFLKIIKSVYR